MAASFTRRFVPALGRDVHRLGLACNYGVGAAGFDAAMERGLDYVFWTSMRTGKVKPALKRALATKRERVVLASGASIGWFGVTVRRAAESLLRELGTDYLDVFHIFWVGTAGSWTDATLEAIHELKAAGKIRAFGISIHDRPRAGLLARDPRLDLMMLRYNAAHPGAERDVFPHLGERSANPPAVVAYTATSWRRLLARPRGWQGEAMTAGDCYRFCLSSPHVDLVLTGPKNEKELEENLAALDRGPLTPDEDAWMRDFGRHVHG